MKKNQLGPYIKWWSNLVNLVKLNQTWSNTFQTCIIWYGSLQSTPLKEKFRPRNSYLCHGRDEDTGSAFGLPAPKSLPRLGGFSKGPSLRILSCCKSPSLLYPESALAAPHMISHPSAQSLVFPTHVRNLEYICVAWRCGTHYGLEKTPPANLIYRPLDLSHQQSQKVRCSEDLASLASTTVVVPPRNPTVMNGTDTSQNLIVFNVHAQVPLKFTGTNYSSWWLLFTSLLFRYDLVGFVDGSKSCPLVVITLPNAASPSPNPNHILWLRQDKLLLNAIIGSLSATLADFISTATTSHATWITLETTYASPSRERIMTHRHNLVSPQQGNRTISEYMQDVKHNINSLALMNVSIDFDELFIRVLNDLGLAYSNISHALQARATLVTFEKLFNQLLSYEAQMKFLVPSTPPYSTLATALVTSPCPSSNHWPNNRGGRNHARSQQSWPLPNTPLLTSSSFIVSPASSFTNLA